MRVKPILFNTDMVKAILDGRKTVTRRVVKPQLEPFGKAYIYKATICSTRALHKQSPYQPGDILYVRETYVKADDGYHYSADATPDSEQIRREYGYKYKPSIHMPKKAARIWLKVTNVRVERLQDITTDQIEAEGAKIENDYRPLNGEEKQYAFSQLWVSTVKETDIDRYGWDANPWVFVIEFERCEKPQEV